MNVLSLNTWGGEVGLPKLLDFIRTQSETVDIFCFQEVWNGGEHMMKEKAAGRDLSKRISTLLSDIKKVLPEYEVWYRPFFYDFHGMAMFVKKNTTVIDEGELYIYREKGFISETEYADHARTLQWATILTDSGPRTIIQLHGLWNGQGKGDSDDRIEQSRRIIEFISTLKNPFVLVGDFNLRPDTQSVKMLEDAGLRNLISEYGITSTRTSLYSKPEKFADYAFVSMGIEVKDFQVLPDEVSDHAPLLLSFE